MIRKCLAIGIILLFVGVTIAPTINAQDNDKSILLDSIPITVLECKADGTVEKTVVRMSREQADSFYEEMRNAQDLEMRLSIYKKYNLISQDVAVDSLQAGMQEKAQRIGVSQDSLISLIKNNRSLFQRNVYRNIFCSIYGYTYQSGRPILIPFGTSLFNLIYFFSNTKLHCIDAIDFIIGKLPISTKGELGEFECNSIIVTMVGFVGIMYYFHHNIDWGFELDGFCAYVKATGVPD
jgi:hypothetical protein